MSPRAVLLLLGTAALCLAAACRPCSPDPRTCASRCDERGFTVLVTDGARKPARGTAVPVSILVATAHSDVRPRARELRSWVDEVTARTGELLRPCALELEVRRAELVAIPSAELTVVASSSESSGAAPVDGGIERLTPPAKRLLEFGRRGLAEDTLAIIAVDRIEHYVERRRTAAGGLSFPPGVYRHPDDFPAHLGVLVATAYGQCGGVPAPPAERTVAHELGHVLLDLHEHDLDPENLMSRMLGPTLRPEQCQRMHQSLKRLAARARLSPAGE